MSAKSLLMNEYKGLSKEPWVNIEVNEEDMLKWNLALMVLNPDSIYYGGYFKAYMDFPHTYPYSPPSFRFSRPLYHPNIYDDGKLCISILHTPGEDMMSGEDAGERWSPAQKVESVLLSILSLLDDPEVSSPANVDAGVLLRKDRKAYETRIKKDVEASKADIPEGFVMPTHESTKPPVVEKIDDDFWADSDQDNDFGGSDSDEEMTMDDDDDEDLEAEEDDSDSDFGARASDTE